MLHDVTPQKLILFIFLTYSLICLLVCLFVVLTMNTYLTLYALKAFIDEFQVPLHVSCIRIKLLSTC